MRYAIQDRLTVIVAAADTLVEFDELMNQVDTNRTSIEKIGAASVEIPSVIDLMSDERYEGFRRSPVVISHDTEESLNAFNERYGVVVIKRNALLRKQEEMLDQAAPAEAEDERSIEELYGLDAEDPWDTRTAEEIEQDAEMKKLYDEAKKKDGLSGDSFAPAKKKKNKEGVYVTDIHSHTDSDGNVVLDRALAVKVNEKKTKQKKAKAVPEDADSEDITIDPNGQIAIYHRVDVHGAKLSEVWPYLDAVHSTPIVKRNYVDGCWFAYITLSQAEKAVDAITSAGFTVDDNYGVNDIGERLAPKGIQIVDPNAALDAIEPPRPWNDRAAELDGMTEEEALENKKSLAGKDFYITGTYEIIKGTIVHITPRTYFDKTGEMWPEPLNIAHLLPQDLLEVEPGMYQSKSRDWNHVSYDMARRGFAENMMVQVYLNNL